ncbi:hypothetical protein ABK040_013053 [Willaertia magna]
MVIESNNNEVLVSMLMLLTHLYSSEQLLSISQQLQDEEQSTILQTQQQQLEPLNNQTIKDLNEESNKDDLLQELLDISFDEENLFFTEPISFKEPIQETHSENTVTATNNNLTNNNYNSSQPLPHSLSQLSINCCKNNYTNSLTSTVCCQPQFINDEELFNNKTENHQVVVNNNNINYYNKRKRESISSSTTVTETFPDSPLKSQPKKSKRGISLQPHEFVFKSENYKNNNNVQQLFILHTPQEMQQQLEAMKIKKRRGRPRKYLKAKHNK